MSNNRVLDEEFLNYDKDEAEFLDGIGPNEIQASQPNSMVQAQAQLIQELLGGQDVSQILAIMPERLDFDKKSGVWMAESLSVGMTSIEAKLVAATTGWAIWSNRVGKPESLTFGPKPDDGRDYKMGIRLVLEIEDNLFYWDAFGLTFKAAHSAIRRAQKFDGWFVFDGFKTIETDNGPFRVPTLTNVSEG